MHFFDKAKKIIEMNSKQGNFILHVDSKLQILNSVTIRFLVQAFQSKNITFHFLVFQLFFSDLNGFLLFSNKCLFMYFLWLCFCGNGHFERLF